MKKILMILAAALLMAGCNNGDKSKDATSGKEQVSLENLVEVTIDVQGMTCEGCENAIEKSVGSLAGISEVSASHLDSVTTVKFDSTLTNMSAIKEKIEAAGYTVVN